MGWSKPLGITTTFHRLIETTIATSTTTTWLPPSQRRYRSSSGISSHPGNFIYDDGRHHGTEFTKSFIVGSTMVPDRYGDIYYHHHLQRRIRDTMGYQPYDPRFELSTLHYYESEQQCGHDDYYDHGEGVYRKSIHPVRPRIPWQNDRSSRTRTTRTTLHTTKCEWLQREWFHESQWDGQWYCYDAYWDTTTVLGSHGIAP